MRPVRHCGSGGDRQRRVFKDDFGLASVPGHPATGLLQQAEGDFIWAIDATDLFLSDPPVTGYLLDYHALDVVFERVGKRADSPAELGLVHVQAFLPNVFGAATVDSPDDPSRMSAMTADFPVVRWIGGVQVFEGPGKLALISPNPYEQDRAR